MSNKNSAAFNPGVGLCYFITEIKTGKQVRAATLCVRDDDQRPWRSSRSCPDKKMWFKMKIGTKRDGFTYIKFMNSNQHSKCLSEDGVYEFTGLKLNGDFLPRLSEIPKKKKVINEETLINNNQVRYKIENGDNSVMSSEKIQENVQKSILDDFTNDTQLQGLLANE
jgi:hypothetical protein